MADASMIIDGTSTISESSFEVVNHDDVVESLAAYASSVKVGDGADEGTRLGPVNNRPQLERVAELVDDAVRGGARVATGGAIMERDGYFFEPTILADLADGERVADEEQFGPALPLWTDDPARGGAVASRIDAPTVWINTHAALSMLQPFGGHKWSGVGVENRRLGMLELTEVQVVHSVR
jgi:acyl-CoA reductase-like NAD-dependent aldehyde dehydrogenase